ncbi:MULTISPECIES: GerAB/ArcD/ProY family transporter [Priestia]|nr:GerAB/ArcD/ProY family transporter [Priestia aryabhattai]
MFIFILGSTLLLDIGKAAKQDAWIVPLLATIFGCVLTVFSVYLLIQEIP